MKLININFLVKKIANYDFKTMTLIGLTRKQANRRHNPQGKLMPEN